MKTSYTYDGAGRFSYAEEKKGSTFNSSWQYCYDLAGNLTNQDTTEDCPHGTTYTINDAQQITSKNGSTTNWSYDAEGHETAGASTPEGTRTGEKWSDHSQLTSLTMGGTAYEGHYGSTDQSERIRLGDTHFHNGPLGLSAASTAGADTGFNREPGGTLHSMTREGKPYFYLTDAIGSVIAVSDETGEKVNTYSYSPRGVQQGPGVSTAARLSRAAALSSSSIRSLPRRGPSSSWMTHHTPPTEWAALNGPASDRSKMSSSRRRPRPSSRTRARASMPACSRR